MMELLIDCVKMLRLYQQAVAAGLKRAQTDAEQECCGQSVVVDEASAMAVIVMTIEGQFCVSVARKQHGTKVDL